MNLPILLGSPLIRGFGMTPVIARSLHVFLIFENLGLPTSEAWAGNVSFVLIWCLTEKEEPGLCPALGCACSK